MCVSHFILAYNNVQLSSKEELKGLSKTLYMFQQLLLWKKNTSVHQPIISRIWC